MSSAGDDIAQGIQADTANGIAPSVTQNPQTGFPSAEEGKCIQTDTNGQSEVGDLACRNQEFQKETQHVSSKAIVSAGEIDMHKATRGFLDMHEGSTSTTSRANARADLGKSQSTTSLQCSSACPWKRPDSTASANEEVEDDPGPGMKRSASGSLVPEFTVKQGERPVDAGIARVTNVLPAVSKVFGNVVGLSLMAGSYGVGKVEMLLKGERKDMAESKCFHYGIKAWMYGNGIFPSVSYEPLEESDGPGWTDPENLRHQPMIVANHVSYMDGMILGCTLGCPRVLVKEEMRRYPFFGFIAEEMHAIFVKREDKGSKKAAIEAIKEHLETWGRGRRPLLIFPEGTTSNGEGLINFSKGAFVGGNPVRPVLIAYPGDVAASTYYIEHNGQIERTDDSEWAENFFGRLLHRAHVRVLRPYYPSTEEKEDAQLYADNCRAVMLEKLHKFRKELGFTSGEEASRGGDNDFIDKVFGKRNSVVQLLDEFAPKTEQPKNVSNRRRATTGSAPSLASNSSSSNAMHSTVVHRMFAQCGGMNRKAAGSNNAPPGRPDHLRTKTLLLQGSASSTENPTRTDQPRPVRSTISEADRKKLPGTICGGPGVSEPARWLEFAW